MTTLRDRAIAALECQRAEHAQWRLDSFDQLLSRVLGIPVLQIDRSAVEVEDVYAPGLRPCKQLRIVIDGLAFHTFATEPPGRELGPLVYEHACPECRQLSFVAIGSLARLGLTLSDPGGVAHLPDCPHQTGRPAPPADAPAPVRLVRATRHAVQL